MIEGDALRPKKIRLDLDPWPEEPAGPAHFALTFLPAAVTYLAERGTSIFEAAARAGVAVPTECGGKGTCARCRVILPEPVRPPTYFEKAFIPREDLARGVRLACRTRVDREMTVTVLPEGRRDPRGRPGPRHPRRS
jgi:ferredoxin